MKLIIVILSFTCLVIFACQSNKAVGEMSSQGMPEKEERLANSLLWEISGNSLTETSYLYGTIHIIDKDDYFLPEGTLSAIDLSKNVVFEIDMTEMNDISKMMPLLQKAFMENGTTLKDLLSDEEYTLVKGHFNDLGLPLFFLEKIKPMFLTVFASGDINPGDLQNGSVKSYEMEFASIAENSNKQIGGLETIDYQISIFDSIPYTEQAQMLVESIKSSDVGDEQFKELVDLYKKQDVASLYDVMKGDESIEEYEDILLIQRNKNWIPIMSQMMLVEKTFFAVGAGHLGGPWGVINLLKKAGFTVRPYSNISTSNG